MPNSSEDSEPSRPAAQALLAGLMQGIGERTKNSALSEAGDGLAERAVDGSEVPTRKSEVSESWGERRHCGGTGHVGYLSSERLNAIAAEIAAREAGASGGDTGRNGDVQADVADGFARKAVAAAEVAVPLLAAGGLVGHLTAERLTDAAREMAVGKAQAQNAVAGGIDDGAGATEQFERGAQPRRSLADPQLPLALPATPPVWASWWPHPAPKIGSADWEDWSDVVRMDHPKELHTERMRQIEELKSAKEQVGHGAQASQSHVDLQLSAALEAPNAPGATLPVSGSTAALQPTAPVTPVWASWWREPPPKIGTWQWEDWRDVVGLCGHEAELQAEYLRQVAELKAAKAEQLTEVPTSAQPPRPSTKTTP